MQSNLEIVKTVLSAISKQDDSEALRYVSPNFVQHYAHIADGREGLRHYILDSKPANLQFDIVRAIEDGPYVVVQLKSESFDADLFVVYRFEDGLIAEHWAFDAPSAPPNQSGHTQVDGPTESRHLKDTERNKAFLRDYYETFHIRGDHGQNGRFFTGEVMIRHEPGVHDGVSEFLHDVESLMQHRTIDQIELLVGEGDLVFIAAKGTHEDAPCVYIDLYRVENEKIVEHWGFPQAAPPEGETKDASRIL